MIRAMETKGAEMEKANEVKSCKKCLNLRTWRDNDGDQYFCRANTNSAGTGMLRVVPDFDYVGCKDAEKLK